MSSALDELVSRYRDKGVLVDSNLLLLFLIGAYRKNLIPNFKRTGQFMVADFETLLTFLDLFNQVITTPHVLTEVSNLANHLPDTEKSGFYQVFHFFADKWSEHTVPSKTLLSNVDLRILGLADLAISNAGHIPVLVLTDDFRLAGKLRRMSVDVINFNHLRPYA